MSTICEKCGKKPVAGRFYARRGLAKKKGGVGRKITGITRRRFSPNIQIVRIKEAGGTVRRARLCTKCLRTGLRDGTISKAPRKPRPPKAKLAPVFEAVTGSLAPPEALEREAAAVARERSEPKPVDMSDTVADELESAYEDAKDAEADKRMESLRDQGHGKRRGKPKAPPE